MISPCLSLHFACLCSVHGVRKALHQLRGRRGQRLQQRRAFHDAQPRGHGHLGRFGLTPIGAKKPGDFHGKSGKTEEKPWISEENLEKPRENHGFLQENG